MSRSRTSPLLVAALGAVLAIGLAGCTVAEPQPTPTPTPIPTLAPSGDGVLRIGTLLPATGDAAALGPAQVAGVEAAIRDVNEAGGVNGAPVEVLHRDSGDATTPRAEQALADLVARGVDVVIGPSSLPLAERLAPLAAEANVTLVALVAPSAETAAVDVGDALFTVVPADPAAVAASAPDEALLTRIRRADPAVTDATPGLAAYDATVAAALAARSAGDDAGPSVAFALRSVTGEGIRCTGFGECVAALDDGQEIDFDGATGPLDLDVAGDAAAPVAPGDGADAGGESSGGSGDGEAGEGSGDSG